MQDPNIPLVRDIVLVGGGHAHALVLRMWAMRPLPGVRLTLINPDPAAPYTGMLPGLIAGHYTRSDLMIDLVRLARFAGARLILDRATGIDRAGRRILLQGRAPLDYDLASINVGITSDLPDTPGFALHAVAAKPLGEYAARWETFLARDLPAPQIVIVGGGVGGIELALASARRLEMAKRRGKITVLQAGPLALPGIGDKARDRLLTEVRTQGIEVLTDSAPAQAEADCVVLRDGRRLPSDFTLTATGARPQAWLAATGLDLRDGFIAVKPTLQSSDPLIFGSGDCADMTQSPRPKAGVYAVRQAPTLLHNLRASLTGGVLQRYRPQRDHLKLISMGDKTAMADKWGMQSGGARLWQVKDWIDRRFMAKFGDYPPMPGPVLPEPMVDGLVEAMGDRPLCGGCGAKVGPMGLAATVAALPRPRRADVIAGAGDDAAVLKAEDGVQVISTDHLRAFGHYPRFLARVAAIHALGDVWAMGAAPQVSLAQITWPRLSDVMQARMMGEIMDEAVAVFNAAGADVVGGHSSVGAELTIGFTVTGLAEWPVTKAGAKTGDALILTKPLGTGAIMAAEMMMARVPGMILGEAVVGAYANMIRPLAAASILLAPVAHAMTDVTGFGLAGHLMEMLEASGVAARLTLSAIPLLPGAEQLAAAGHASSLSPANRAALLGRVTGASGPRAAMLFDPQTGGGLLAAVAAADAPGVLASLLAAGEVAAIIGEIVPGAAGITLVA